MGILVMYDTYPGSIVDVSTSKNTILNIKAQGINSYTLIMDRGFFSTENIVELVSSDVSFIIPPASTLKNVKEAISSIHSRIEDPDYLKMYQKEPLFVMPVVLDIGDIRLNGYDIMTKTGTTGKELIRQEAIRFSCEAQIHQP